MARRKFPKSREFDEFEKIDVEPQADEGAPEGLQLPEGMQSKLSTAKNCRSAH